MIPEKFTEVLKHEGVVAIVTQGKESPHAANTWNSYLTITDDESILVPVGGMQTTEANVRENSRVLMTLGSREVEGYRSMGTGFLITGTAYFLYDGTNYDAVKQKYPWARAVLKIRTETIKQTL